jgi:hypothetical protein
MDQTTLAASLSIIGNALGASDQTSWISGGYFVSVYCYSHTSQTTRLPDYHTNLHIEHQHVSNYFMGNYPTFGLAN